MKSDKKTILFYKVFGFPAYLYLILSIMKRSVLSQLL